MKTMNMEELELQEIDELRRQVKELREQRDYFAHWKKDLGDKLAGYAYDYRPSVRDSVEEWLDEWEKSDEGSPTAVVAKYDCVGELEDELTERMRGDDRVTGLRSGSWTYDREAAEMNLAHNRGLLVEAYKFLGFDEGIDDMRLDDAEVCDARIREYLVCGMAPVIVHARYGHWFLDDRKPAGSSKGEAR